LLQGPKNSKTEKIANNFDCSNRDSSEERVLLLFCPAKMAQKS
jgi:hypothetical protein